MFPKLIEFKAPEEYIKNNQDLLPTPMVSNTPDWFNELKHSVNNKTIKGCMPFLDSLISGYLLKLPSDFYIEHNVQVDGKKSTQAVCPNRIRGNLNQQININYENIGEFHHPDQLGKSELVEKNKNLPFHKILNPWVIKTPPGYSCLFTPPLNNRDDRFEIMSGIVDTDTFPSEINFPIIFNGDKYPSLKTTLKVGTPYVQVIPFKRDNWKLKIKKNIKKEKNESEFFLVRYVLDNYKKKFWKKKSWK
jgi:hypothetical protein